MVAIIGGLLSLTDRLNEAYNAYHAHFGFDYPIYGEKDYYDDQDALADKILDHIRRNVPAPRVEIPKDVQL